MTSRSSGASICRRRAQPRILLALLTVAAIAAAWWQRFVMDDAFISFRYAANWAAGHGLVWNLGERVEGYTNFLWTVMLGVAIRLGGDPIPVSQVLGIAAFAVSLVASYRLAATWLGSETRALWVPALLAGHYSYLRFATGGLETSMQAAVVTVLFALTSDMTRRSGAPHLLQLLSLGVTASAGLLLRLDSALPAGLCLVAATLCLGRERSARRRLAGLAALALPGLVLISVWLRWKAGYYGELLPNTYYAKAAGVSMVSHGWDYLALFARQYFLPVLLPFWLAGLVVAGRRPTTGPLLLFVGVLAWCAYLVRVGGDFMEFRLLVPVLPLFMTCLVWSLFELRLWRGLRVALLLVVPAASLVHGSTFREFGAVEAIPSLAEHVESEGVSWSEVGRALRHYFSETERPVVVAATPIGAIGYYSRLPVVDMHGLTDPWVARHGAVVRPRPGHLRLAPVAYLVARQTHLLLAHPVFGRLPDREGDIHLRDVLRLFRPILDPQSIPRSARVLQVPLLRSEMSFGALYLVPSPEIDQRIQEHGMSSYGILFPGP